MREKDVLKRAFAMPLTNPSYPPGPYRFVNREYLIITYRTDPAKLRAVVPEPLELDEREALVKYEFIRMPDSNGFGDYTESGQVIPVSFRGRRGGYTHCMFLNDEGPIAGGRELWGFPKKLAQPTLRTEIDTLVGTLDYGPLRVATGTMGYKHREADLAQVKASLEAPNFLLKIIPHVDGSPRICELVEYHLEHVLAQGRVDRPRRVVIDASRFGTGRGTAGSRSRVRNPHRCGPYSRARQGRARLFAATQPTSAAHQRESIGDLIDMNGSLGGSRVAIRRPRARNNRASAHLRRMQFLPAGLTEIPQRIDFVDQIGQVDQCSVGKEISLNDQSARLLCRVIHTIARQYFHPADERIQADHFRDLGLVVHERIGVEPRGFLNEALVELLTPGTGSCCSAVVILPALSSPPDDKRQRASRGRAPERSHGGEMHRIHSRALPYLDLAHTLNTRM